MNTVIVTSKADVVDAYFKHDITHILTILDPTEPFKLPNYVDTSNWKRFNCEDTHNLNNRNAPSKKMVQDILDWAKTIPNDANLLVHCFAGVSRSTAVAISIMVQKYGVERIDHCINHIKSMRKVCAPNPIITRYADDILNCQGVLHNKCQAIVQYPNLLEMFNVKEDS